MVQRASGTPTGLVFPSPFYSLMSKIPSDDPFENKLTCILKKKKRKEKKKCLYTSDTFMREVSF
jgi:hypothetical protein